MDNSSTTSSSPQPSLVPATPAGGEKSASKSALASEAGAFSSGRLDNNGALLGVTGAKFVDPASKPPVQYDANGHVVALDERGYPVKKPGFGVGSENGAGGLSGQAGGLGQGSLEKGPGDSYKEMAKQLELRRQAESMAAAHRHAMAAKTRIVEELRTGKRDKHLLDELAQLNRDVFNLPADHTGY